MSTDGNGPLRVAVAGLGRSGNNIHVRCMLKMQDRFKVVAVADQIAARRDEAAAEYGARTYDDWQALIADGDFDLFVNALPSPLHVPGAVAALEAGKHLICEKPLARTVAECDQVINAAKANDRVFAPFQNNRPQPFFEKIQEVIASGVLGKIIYIQSNWGGFRRRWDWQTWQENMGGVLFNTGPHALDQALCLFGFENKPEVFCRMDCNNAFTADADDHCTVTLYDPNRVAPQIDVNITTYYAYPPNYMYMVNGQYGGLCGGANGLNWKYFDPEKAPHQDRWHWSVDRQYPAEQLDWIEDEWTLPKEEDTGAVGYTLKSLPSAPERIYNNVYEVIHGEGELMIKPSEARRQVEVLEACHAQNPLPKRPPQYDLENLK